MGQEQHIPDLLQTFCPDGAGYLNTHAFIPNAAAQMQN